MKVFNCAIQATEGGASTYADGFAVAERLRVETPEAFDFFSRTSIPYQCFDEGCHYVAEGPIFRLGPLGQVTQVRTVSPIMSIPGAALITELLFRTAA